MKVVYKYPMEHRHNEFSMPQGGRVVHVGEQNGVGTCWIEFSGIPAGGPEEDSHWSVPEAESRQFAVVGTGQPISEAWMYLGNAGHTGRIMLAPVRGQARERLGTVRAASRTGSGSVSLCETCMYAGCGGEWRKLLMHRSDVISRQRDVATVRRRMWGMHNHMDARCAALATLRRTHPYTHLRVVRQAPD